MIELLQRIGERLQSSAYVNEAAITHGIVSPVLKELGWDTADPRQVIPEFSNARGRVDFALIGLAQLDPTAVHRTMVTTIKRTRDLAPLSNLVDHLPRSLHAAALSIQVRRADHGRIVKAVSTPLDAAMVWA